jgi:hypothetical protein
MILIQWMTLVVSQGPTCDNSRWRCVTVPRCCCWLACWVPLELSRLATLRWMPWSAPHGRAEILMHIPDVQLLTSARRGSLPLLEPWCDGTEASCCRVHRVASSWAMTTMTITAGTMTTAAGARCATMRCLHLLHSSVTTPCSRHHKPIWITRCCWQRANPKILGIYLGDLEVQSLCASPADLQFAILDIQSRYTLPQDHGDDVQTLSSEFKIFVRSGDVCKGCRGEQQSKCSRAQSRM